MIFNDPLPRTSADIHFRWLGVPMRISIWFWVGSALLGMRGYGHEPRLLLIWILAVFLAIFAHEMGHLLAYLRYRIRPSELALVAFGGYVAAPSGGFQLTVWRRIFISFAGPLAGFLFAGLVLLVQILLYGPPGSLGDVSLWIGVLPNAGWVAHPQWQLLFHLLSTLYLINVIWGLINLLPVYPLDGGQIAQAWLVHKRGRHPGWTATAQLGVVVGIVVCIWGFSSGDTFFGLLFAMLALSNYQMLQQMRGGGFRAI